MRFVLFAILISTLSATAWALGPVLNVAQRKLVAQDSCAAAALRAATGAFVEEIEAAGVDLPEKIYVQDIVVLRAGGEYSVSFVGGDVKFRVETQMAAKTCRYSAIQSTP